MTLRDLPARQWRALRATTAHNWLTLRTSPLSELSGSLGDLGTLLPLLLALSNKHRIDLPATLVFSGLANLLTGAIFGIPLPVQPMKVLAATSLATGISLAQTVAAGFLVGLAVAFLAATGLLRWCARVIPIPIIKGIQVGTGLSLVLSAQTNQFSRLWLWSYDYSGFWIVATALFLVRTGQHAPRVPSALVIFVVGIVILLCDSYLSDVRAPALWAPRWYFPFFTRPGFTFSPVIDAAAAQLPLTVLNSIIAVTHLSADLLPDVAAPSANCLAASVAAMNVVGCSFGAMPVCHGSGGLAAQYRFGARSGASVMLLGIVKLVLGLFFGEFTLSVLGKFPDALLGVMVVFAGLELARVGESLNTDARDLFQEVDDEQEGGEDARGEPSLDQPPKRPREVGADERQRRWSVMLATVAGLLCFKNALIGCIAGLMVHLSYAYPPGWRSRRHETEGRVRLRDDGEERRGWWRRKWSWPSWGRLSGGPDLIGVAREEGEAGAINGSGVAGGHEPYQD